MSSDLRKLRVLVVEDQPLIAMDIKEMVELLGHEVIGPIAVLEEAIDVATHAALDCAIMDINIRGGHSYPAVDILLERGFPVLLLTGYGKDNLPESVQRAAYIQKPFTEFQLNESIGELYNTAIKFID